MSIGARRLLRAASGALSATTSKMVAVYYPGYSRTTGVGGTTIANLNWNSFTHIIDFSLGLHNGHLSHEWLANGSSTPDTNWWTASQAAALCTAAAAHDKQVLICVGNAETSESWNANLNTAGKRSTIAAEIADTIAQYGYDGVNLDGEPSSQVTNYRLFWQAIIAEFTFRGWRTPASAQYKSVSMACYPADVSIAKNAVQDGFDWVAPMLYTPYENTSQHISPLSGAGYPWDAYQAKYTTGVNAIPSDKFMTGMSYYSFSWPGVTGPNQSSSTFVGDRNWADVNTTIGGVSASSATWYPTAAMHGMTIGNSWYSFESAQSVQAKADWFASHESGGLIIWMYQHGSLGGANHPLASAVQDSFGHLM